MSVRVGGVLEGGRIWRACLVDSVTERVIGALFTDIETAEAFLAWVEEETARDVRTIMPAELDTLRWEFDKERENREPSDVEMFGAGSR